MDVKEIPPLAAGTVVFTGRSLLKTVQQTDPVKSGMLDIYIVVDFWNHGLCFEVKEEKTKYI